MFEMAEIKVEKFEIVDVITTSSGCPLDGVCVIDGTCPEFVPMGG